mgnify:CR=1 FL=1
MRHALVHRGAHRHRHLRRPSHGHVLLARRIRTAPRAHPRSGLRRRRRSRRTSRNSRSSSRRSSDAVPVIAIDGPSASGKGTVAGKVSRGRWASAISTAARSTASSRCAAISARARPRRRAACSRGSPQDMEIDFREGQTWLGGRDVTADLRSESVSAAASRVAAHPSVRQGVAGPPEGISHRSGPRRGRARHGLRGVP